MWTDTIFLLLLFYYTSNGQIEQASIAEQREKLLGGKKTLIGGKKLLALHAKKPEIDQVADSKSHRWPKGQVKYFVDENSYDKPLGTKLEIAFSLLAAYDDCPVFSKLDEKPVGDVGAWLHFTNPDRVRPCVHEPGGTASPGQGEIVVVLGYDCLKPREILHSVMHGLGFHDEVTHPQRDLFVKIMWDDIQPAFRSMFRIRSMREPGGLLDYDPRSIMHFHDHAYSLTGRPTIAPLLPGLSIEPSNELSHIDKMKLRLLFAHECKKQQIDQILDSCATNNNNDGNDNNNGDDRIVIPGNDVTAVKPDYGDPVSDDEASGDDSQIVIPGNDVTAVKSDYGDPVSDDEASGDDSQIVIPGNDVTGVKPDYGDPQSDNDVVTGDGQIVIAGNDISTIEDIKPEEGVVVEGNDVNISAETGANQASEEHETGNEINGGAGDKSQKLLEEHETGHDDKSEGIKTMIGDKSQVSQEER